MKKELAMKLRSGKVNHFKNQREYFEFWDTIEGQGELNKALGIEKSIRIKKNLVEFKRGDRTIKMYAESNRQLSDTTSAIREQFFEEPYAISIFNSFLYSL